MECIEGDIFSNVSLGANKLNKGFFINAAKTVAKAFTPAVFAKISTLKPNTNAITNNKARGILIGKLIINKIYK